MQTHLVSNIMHQNLAIILQHFNYCKNSFIVLFPEVRWGRSDRDANLISFQKLKFETLNKLFKTLVLMLR